MADFDGGAFDDLDFDVLEGVPNTVYWGPHFPDASGVGFYWGPHFPDGKPDAAVIPPSTPGGAATFLLLESGSKIALSWATDQKKMWGGREYRAQFLDDPKRTFTGVATLKVEDVLTMRARLARFAAIGSVFSLGIPFEAISIRGLAAGAVIPTTDTTKSDWMEQGQRVAVTDGAGNSIDAVIQGFTANTVTLDVDPGDLGREGCVIMPVVPIFFSPTMNFARFRGTNVIEQWQLMATAAVFGYPVVTRNASAALSGSAGALHDVVVSAVAPDVAGNAYSIQFIGDATPTSIPPLFGTHVTHSGTDYVVHYAPGLTAIESVATLLAAVFTFGGGWVAGARIGALVSDDVGPVQLVGGVLGGYGTMGAGATVATYDDRPVWDRRIQVQDTASDSIQSLAELVDLNGLPISIGTANQADWGRALYMQRTDRDEWQWLKAFLSTVRGAQRAFWLPSFRPDLIAVAGPDDASLPGFYSGGMTPRITIRTGEASGDVFAWFPNQRDRLFIRQLNGFTAMVRIESIEDFGDGTAELTLDWFAAPELPDAASPIDLVCWLELVRFDSSDFEVTWDHGTFTMETKARVVQQ